MEQSGRGGVGFEKPVELAGFAEEGLDGVVEEVVVAEGEDDVAEILFQRPVEEEHIGERPGLAVPEGVEQAAQLVALAGALREGGDEAAEALGGVDGGGGVLAADGLLAGEELVEDGLVFGFGGEGDDGWFHNDLRAVVSGSLPGFGFRGTCAAFGFDRLGFGGRGFPQAAQAAGFTGILMLCFAKTFD